MTQSQERTHAYTPHHHTHRCTRAHTHTHTHIHTHTNKHTPSTRKLVPSRADLNSWIQNCHSKTVGKRKMVDIRVHLNEEQTVKGRSFTCQYIWIKEQTVITTSCYSEHSETQIPWMYTIHCFLPFSITHHEIFQQKEHLCKCMQTVCRQFPCSQ